MLTKVFSTTVKGH